MGSNQFVLLNESNGAVSVPFCGKVLSNGIVETLGLSVDGLCRVASVAIDVNVAAPQPLFTVPAGRKLAVAFVVAHNETADLSLLKLSMGYTGPNYTDILSSVVMNGLNTVGQDYVVIAPAAGAQAKLGFAGDILMAIDSTLQVGAAPGSTVTLEVYGVLL